MLEEEIAPWSIVEFSTLEMARQSRLLSHSNISSLKNILKRQKLQDPEQRTEHLIVKKTERKKAHISVTPNKQLIAAEPPPLLRANHKSIELSRDKLIRKKTRIRELHHQSSFSRLDAGALESNEIVEPRPARLERVSRVVMPQIISKSPKDIRNPQAWKDLTDEKIFRPLRRLGRQKRQDSFILPKVKIVLSSSNYRTIETD